MTTAEILAAFTSDLAPERLPAAVVANARLRVLDTLGITLTSTAQDFAPSVLGAVGPWRARAGGATAIGVRGRVPANGALAHGLDFGRYAHGIHHPRERVRGAGGAGGG